MRGELRRIQVNIDLAPGATPNVGPGHTRHPLDTSFHVVFQPVRLLVDPDTGRITRQWLNGVESKRMLRHRIRSNARLIHIFGVAGYLGQRIGCTDQGLIDVHAKGELQLDGARAEGRRGDHSLQTLHVAQEFFLLDQDFPLDILRVGAGPDRLYRDNAWVQVGYQLNGNTEQCGQAKQANDRDLDDQDGGLFKCETKYHLINPERL